MKKVIYFFTYTTIGITILFFIISLFKEPTTTDDLFLKDFFEVILWSLLFLLVIFEFQIGKSFVYFFCCNAKNRLNTFFHSLFLFSSFGVLFSLLFSYCSTQTKIAEYLLITFISIFIFTKIIFIVLKNK